MNSVKVEGAGSGAGGTADAATSSTATGIAVVKKERTDATETKPPANCYCAKERNMSTVELLCATCNKWFHEACITVPLGKLIPFATNYVFFCKACTTNGAESFRKCQASKFSAFK